MKPLFALTTLVMLATPAAASDLTQCEALRIEQGTAYQAAIMKAATNIDKRARCLAARDALTILDRMVEATQFCPAAETTAKHMVSRRRAIHASHCGTELSSSSP